jgi:hypothetical protein
MRMECADCGCVVDRGVVVEACGGQECCCLELPREKDAEPDVSGR